MEIPQISCLQKIKSHFQTSASDSVSFTFGNRKKIDKNNNARRTMNQSKRDGDKEKWLRKEYTQSG